MQNKIKMKLFVILCITLIIPISETLKAKEVNNEESSSAARREENLCGFYTHKVVNPLLDHLLEIQAKLKDHESLIAGKDRKIIELQLKVAESVQKDKTIEIYRKLEDSSAAQIGLLRENIRLLAQSCHCKNESHQLAEPNRTIAAFSETIIKQNSQMMKFQAQNDSENAKLQKSEDQLANSLDLIRVKDETIINQVKNISSIANKTQFELEEIKKINFEDLSDSCLPFATSPGIHTIEVPGISPFNVLCQSTVKGPGWIVIQQRINGGEDFYRNWTTYQAGFGSLDGDFFLGLEKIHRLTSNRRNELFVYLEKFDGEITYARYNNFAIAGADDQYRLINVDGFSTNTTNYYDCMKLNKESLFYTFDRDNLDECAKVHQGGWWYDSCGASNLNGIYYDHDEWGETTNFWYPYSSNKKTQMLIRPKLN